ncbi:PIN domain-containing protein [uncultured Mycobacterium sp.]|uniref:PIN domain-containing protein n=1 Tax=uncultured Mycobacterium sp. TaxID=171292 RepID=UPI0035CA51F4
MRVVLDTSVLIGEEPPSHVEAAISVASIAELHFGALVASDEDERALRVERLGAIESAFEPLPITVEIAREWGRLSAAVSNRGGQPRRRSIDLVIAATASIHGVPLLTHNTGDFLIIGDLIDVRRPSEVQPPEPGANTATVDQ